MTAYKCTRFVQHNGTNYPKGSSITLDPKKDVDTIAHLENNRAIESLEVIEKKSENISENLMKVDGVSKTVAATLIKQGITKIDQLGVMELKELENLDGVSKKIAKQIFNAFTEK